MIFYLMLHTEYIAETTGILLEFHLNSLTSSISLKLKLVIWAGFKYSVRKKELRNKVY